MNDEKVVCTCMDVTVGDIREAIKNGAKDFEEVQEITGVSSVCGMCRDYAKNVVKAILDGE